MTPKLQSDERRCRPINQWPQPDRQRWQAALQTGDRLEQGGCPAEHSRSSNPGMEKGYSRWLALLDIRGLLDERDAPADCIMTDRGDVYDQASDSEYGS